ncbi:MAG: hypothetical protein HC901_01620 [Bdellovibrionaceae bacterium]|nr:hypothetical protein [Pseudobdellovibrionaceae bacterium]
MRIYRKALDAQAAADLKQLGGYNKPPRTDAGNDQTLELIAPVATLNGTTTDDGVPSNATLTPAWSLVSGPSGGTAIFSPNNQLSTSVTFNKIGTYVLKLSVSDGYRTGNDTVTITVVDSDFDGDGLTNSQEVYYGTDYFVGADPGLNNGYVLHEVFTSIAGGNVTALSNTVHYPNVPDLFLH